MTPLNGGVPVLELNQGISATAMMAVNFLRGGIAEIQVLMMSSGDLNSASELNKLKQLFGMLERPSVHEKFKLQYSDSSLVLTVTRTAS